ncbi:acyl-CoA dehydrogenase [Calidifontibacter sp. DB0510]|uniref:Acyl-CoA dehydrogenase n=1 Tax=Metallococcus carri TaxID=1656884 RepID=A0A967EEE6_9MICO|nr:acyl-CoA dehydrogenase family protein [Metallococcus carri]NHN55591.1 acyl-CoA dehydrogenase [Metallococcus carri]NOP38225.1 acyl-CoA dehydrogenase [Calidifontibacter sp. DB2511S]
MSRTLFEEDHEAFRKTARAFFERECVPHREQWDADGIVSRDAWRAAGQAGLIGMAVPEEFGGGGMPDFRFNMVITEESVATETTGLAISLTNDVILPYFLELATDEQKKRWLPDICSGEKVVAIAMTEPGAGSDLQGITTTAVDKGDHYLVNGRKTFISSGILADIVIVVCRTDKDAGHRGISLIVLERGMDGFERGRNLDKIGLHAQDTAELIFDDVQVPKDNLLGAEGDGFIALMQNLPQERLSIATIAAAAIDRVVDMAIDYAKQRQAFGRSIGSFQNTRFTIAEMVTEARVARVYVDDCVRRHLSGELDAAEASGLKYWSTELQKKIVDQAVQIHGGYGFMAEYPVARAYLNTRVQTIYGGTTEIMKEIVGRSLGL